MRKNIEKGCWGRASNQGRTVGAGWVVTLLCVLAGWVRSSAAENPTGLIQQPGSQKTLASRTWSSPACIIQSPYDDELGFGSNIALDHNSQKILVVWEEQWEDQGGDAHSLLFSATYEINAQQWSVPQQVETGTWQQDPYLQAKNGKFHLGYIDENYSVVYRYRMPGGVAWSPKEIVATHPGWAHTGSPALAVGTSGDVHICWMVVDDETGNSMYYRWRSANGMYGNLEEITTDQPDPCTTLGVDQRGQPELFYTHDHGSPVLLRATRDNQLGWENTEIFRFGPWDLLLYPHVAYDSLQKAHVIFRKFYDMGGYSRPAIVYATQAQTGGGRTPRIISGPLNNAVACDRPSFLINGDKVHAVWLHEENDIFSIRYRKLEGAVWSPEEIIASDIPRGVSPAYPLGRRPRPQLAVNKPGAVFCIWDAWDEEADNINLYFSSSGAP